MKGIIGIVVIIGILAVININSENNVVNTITQEDKINSNMAIVSLAKKTVLEQNNQLNKITLIKETNKLEHLQKQNVSSLMDMAKKTTK